MLVGTTDIGIGPAAFLQILLDAADRATDRARARPRATAIKDIMSGISFDRSKEALPSLCFALMQGLTPEEQKSFGFQVAGLEASKMEDTLKSNALGLNLMNLVGEPVLRQAVNIMRSDIKASPKPIVQSFDTLQLLRRVDYNRSRETLVSGCLLVTGLIGDDKAVSDLQSMTETITGLRMSDHRGSPQIRTCVWPSASCARKPRASQKCSLPAPALTVTGKCNRWAWSSNASESMRPRPRRRNVGRI